MKVDVLLGLQWGDEGKGKIVDVLTPKYDVIARFQGGPNAGHTLKFNNAKHVLHTIPSGIFRENSINIIGNGVVIDPVIFEEEIRKLEERGTDISSNLIISEKAHLILPTHRMLDAASEKAKGSKKIGSTLKGIGPTYMDKTGRNGLRVGDVLTDSFETKYNHLVTKHQRLLSQYDYTDDQLGEYEEAWKKSLKVLKKFKIVDTTYLINQQLQEGKQVLAEGAQGTLLDIDFGSYPFVTSSNTICAGACTGLGVAPNKIGEVIGIFKAYCTRVGSGPFPTELHDETGKLIRKEGSEFGATTGRPRRCGWLDLPALKYAIIVNGVTQLTMTKADVLSCLDVIKICTHYEVNGKVTSEIPFDVNVEITPIYKEMKGWKIAIDELSSISELPQELNEYIEYLEKELNIPITIVSVGPGRNQTLERNAILA